ncbi:methyltransferase domain-containing protein [Actinocrispum sp. NPDC049592]|uniref:class I SAM-dependent methyltransferase n=1 Tax=Actinocrispum sp. NPDC049592 TaxID=3154835 RepID=UPI00341C0DE7
MGDQRDGFDYDAELRRYQPRLIEAMAVGNRDTVVDIGCGTGQTSRAAAGLATDGSVLGVDVNPVMLERARRLSDGLENLRFDEGDAQVYPFPQGFSLAISRFGTMFFADPVAAFTNIRRALQPGARLVQLVWQSGDHQEWAHAIQGALGGTVPSGGAFSLSEPSTVDGMLTSAGFTGITVTDVREPVWYGANPDAAVDAVLALQMGSGAATQPDALDRLHQVMTKHNTDDGVWFDSRAWIITARTAG